MWETGDGRWVMRLNLEPTLWSLGVSDVVTTACNPNTFTLHCLVYNEIKIFHCIPRLEINFA